MSDTTINRAASGQAGSSFFLFLLVMSALLAVVTAYAIRANPLYSDRDAYGISKYAFIEQCKERMHNASEVELPGPQGNIKLGEAVRQQPNMLQAGETLALRTANVTSQEMIASVRPVESGKLGLALPVQLVATKEGNDRTITPAVFQCSYARAEGLKAMLGSGQ